MDDRPGFPARGEDDDAVHRTDSGDVALVDPSGARTVCGQRVMEIYNNGRDVTCAVCAA